MASTLRQIWHFLWEDNSILSWIVNVVLAFIIIKFLVYPGLGFVLATTNPVVAVVSCSMEHKASNCAGNQPIDMCGNTFDKATSLDFDEYWKLCGGWYENRSISKNSFSKFQLSNGFNKGDLIILKGRRITELDVGDVIVFHGRARDPTIHRIVSMSEDGSLTTKGDKNERQLPEEFNIAENRVIGQAFFRLPYLGYVKILFTDLVNMVVGR